MDRSQDEPTSDRDRRSADDVVSKRVEMDEKIAQQLSFHIVDVVRPRSIPFDSVGVGLKERHVGDAKVRQ